MYFLYLCIRRAEGVFVSFFNIEFPIKRKWKHLFPFWCLFLTLFKKVFKCTANAPTEINDYRFLRNVSSVSNYKTSSVCQQTGTINLWFVSNESFKTKFVQGSFFALAYLHNENLFQITHLVKQMNICWAFFRREWRKFVTFVLILSKCLKSQRAKIGTNKYNGVIIIDRFHYFITNKFLLEKWWSPLNSKKLRITEKNGRNLFVCYQFFFIPGNF